MCVCMYLQACVCVCAYTEACMLVCMSSVNNVTINSKMICEMSPL